MVASVACRKETLENKKVKNYHTEYDRIGAHLEDFATPHLIRSHVQSRADQLRALGVHRDFCRNVFKNID